MHSISTRAASRLLKFDPKGTVFSEYTALANQFKAVNLGQGFPTLKLAPFLQEAATAAISSPSFHQYTRSEGHPRLVKALLWLITRL